MPLVYCIPHWISLQSFSTTGGPIGGFYTPTNQVENNKDNDGMSHPGSLQYFREEFEKNGFSIHSEHNFS